MSQNSDIFLFLKLGIVSLILEKAYFFAIGNMTQNWSLKCAKESCLVYQKYQENNYRSVPLVLVALLREYAYSADLPWIPNLKKKKKKKKFFFFFFLEFFFCIFPNGCLLN